MRRRAPAAKLEHEGGSAIVEFVVVIVLLMVPLVYLLTAALTVHRAVFASAQAVREAGRAFTLAPSAATGRAQALAATHLAFVDHGVQEPPDALEIRCLEGPCLSPGTAVEVEVTWKVPLPWVPDVVGIDRLAIPVSAVQRIPVDDFRGLPL